MKDFLDDLRSTIENTEETAESINLTLTKEQFISKMLEEKDGVALLNCLEDENKIAERMGLIHGYVKESITYFDIPRWNNLIAHLRIVNGV